LRRELRRQLRREAGRLRSLGVTYSLRLAPRRT